MAPSALFNGYQRNSPMSQQHCRFEASRSLTALEQDSTIIAVIEMSQSKWLVAALVPGVERHPLKKLDAREEELLCIVGAMKLVRLGVRSSASRLLMRLVATASG
jgi:transposase